MEEVKKTQQLLGQTHVIFLDVSGKLFVQMREEFSY